ncbi:MAG: UDP-N-acetylmuramate:L-alanyl-gamma-D-glutamyl-meso-diaminopimelate ligase [Verrucomicrobia bacterium]|nr:MAG: UDP-N-acetylmuramate:L-alanyl-gamma-D-glutamyl-meso-diaminopimelate ligase [Verrucomicrobiota bacterium]
MSPANAAAASGNRAGDPARRTEEKPRKCPVPPCPRWRRATTKDKTIPCANPRPGALTGTPRAWGGERLGNNPARRRPVPAFPPPPRSHDGRVQEPRQVHFIGICGTAMASVAAELQRLGWQVTGSDQNAYPPMSEFLADRGIAIRTPYAGANLPEAPDLVVIGNAISRGNPEAEIVLERRLPFCSLPDLLREQFLRGRRPLVVAGTHGKTTTSAMLAWVLEVAGLEPGFLIGGIPENFGAGARFTDSPWFVIEGDEYDTAFFDKRSKFIHYLPEVAILNNLELDHVDIFENEAAIQRSFSHLIRLVPRNGLVLANGDDPRLRPLLDVDFCPVRTYGFGEHNDLHPTRIEADPEGTLFEADGVEFRLPLAGRHNVLNALAVVACARHCGVNDATLRDALARFRGVRRRQDVLGEPGGVLVIDDFAHHPTAIEATLEALRQRHPGRRLWAVFEPRSNTTRRRVFQERLAAALARADCAVVAPVARAALLAEEERLDVGRLVRDIQAAGRNAWAGENVAAIVELLAAKTRPGDVVAVLSNGGFENLTRRLLERLEAG